MYIELIWISFMLVTSDWDFLWYGIKCVAKRSTINPIQTMFPLSMSEKWVEITQTSPNPLKSGKRLLLYLFEMKNV